MARRSDHSRDEIKEMALQAAERLINQQGHKGLSARKVAAEIGYTVGTLYLVFKNQDEFILHINGRTLDELYQAMGSTIAEQQDAQDCVMALCRTYYDFAVSHSNRWLLIFEHTLPDINNLPDWYEQRIKGGFEMLEKVLQPLVTAHNHKEVGKAARVLWGSVHGISMLAVTRKLDVVGVESVYELIDSLVENYLAGLTR
jgi:AcrR family transcriptional regulator